MKRISLLSKVLLVEYLVFVFILHYRDGIQRIHLDFFHLKLILAGVLSIVCFGEVIHRVGRLTRLRHLFNVLFPTLYGALFTYHYRAKSSFFFSVFADNISEAFSVESLNVILGMFKRGDFYKLGGMILLFIVIAWWFRKLKDKKISPIREVLSILIYISAYFGILISGTPIYEEITAFNQSVYQYYYPKTYKTNLYYDLKKKSALRKFKSPAVKVKPNIFIIAMESFTDYYMFKKENGKEVTPFINSLAKNNFYVRNFYGNSIQTAKGHFAINCSLLPLIKGKGFYLADKVNFKCLPELMRDAGYKTLFFQGYGDRNFDKTSQFSLKNGYEYFKTPTTAGLQKYVWGWGLQDDQSFVQLFNFIDQLKRESNKPIFSFVSTISHHMRFRSVPNELREIYPNSGNDKRMSFINSLHLSDKFLRTFFEELNKRKELKNSIVILVGDHSYPNGQRGLYHSESGYYDESFRTPLVIIGAKKKEVEGVYSQVDIAPTVLELAGISAEAPFVGQSMLGAKGGIAHLIQPYDGVYLSTIKWPYKYVLHLRTGRELLFNLSVDPSESNDIIDSGIPELMELRNEIGRIFYYNDIIKKNQLLK